MGKEVGGGGGFNLAGRCSPSRRTVYSSSAFYLPGAVLAGGLMQKASQTQPLPSRVAREGGTVNI